MVSNVFTDESIRRLKGNIGIGHTRYSTSAASEEVNCQPFVVHTAHGALAVAHNGELVNCDSLRRQVRVFKSFSKTWFLLSNFSKGIRTWSWVVHSFRQRTDYSSFVLKPTRRRTNWRTRLACEN